MNDGEKLSVDEEVDLLADVVAFISARIRNDEEGEMAIIGTRVDNPRRILLFILSLADFAGNLVSIHATSIGVSPDKLLKVLSMTVNTVGRELLSD